MKTWNRCCSGLPWAILLSALFAAPVISADDDKPTAKQTPAKSERPKAVDKKNAGTKAAKKKLDGAKQPVQQKEAKTPERPASEPPSNFISDWIKDLFRGRKDQPNKPILPKKRGASKPAQRKPTNTDASAADKGDEIDRRAPHNPGQSKLLRRAEALLRDGHWKDTVEILQYLLDRPEDSLVRLPKGNWASVRSEANRMLGGLPAQELDNYRLRFGPVAQQLLQEAQTQGEPRLLVEVASRFFHTEAGQQAANHLGSLHFDRGEFGMAALWFRQLLDSGAEVTHDPKWRLKAAFALHHAGNLAAGDQLLKELRSRGSGYELGGVTINPGDWPAAAGPLAVARNTRLDDWPLLYGTPSRTGISEGGAPLLLPRWSAPSTYSRRILDTIGELIQDLADTGRATIPATFPLTVGGKVIFRTLRGVQVVEAQTGRLLWETREGISAERLLNGERPLGFALPGFQQKAQLWPLMRFPYSGSGAEQHPLTSLLFRDGTYGTLSSDGKRLFVIEEHAILSKRQPGYGWGFNANRDDHYRRDWSSNKLVSYDLATGRPHWEVGGAAMEESFDLPLAGHYFFGAPVADGDELFVVSEKDNEIRLLALATQTGEPRWSQMIASSDARIEEDLGRRWWTSQVAVGSGVLVCPTTVGWLVAVDRMNRSVLWAHRYSKPKVTSTRTRFPGQGRSLVQRKELNGRWCPSAPILVGNRVVYTPSEEAVLECLNLFDGKRIWQKPKGKFLYLAGVFDKYIVLVGTDSVAALSPEDGETLWTLPIPSSAGKPSGRGIAAENRYYLPLQSGQLWTVDLQTGKVAAKSYLPDDSRPLGNLAMCRDTLLSLSPFGLTSFEQRDSIENQIRRRKADNPRDPWALVREADIQLLKRDHTAALTALRQIDPKDFEKVADDVRLRYRRAMIDSLQAIIRSDFQTHDDEIEELSAFVESEDERLQYRRLSAERLAARKDYRAAFELYWELARTPDEQMITRSDDPQVRIRMDHWLAGKLTDLWRKMPQNVRAELDDRVAAAAAEAAGGDVAAQARFVTLYGFHPSALTVRRKLVEEYADAGDLIGAENVLLQLSRQPDKTIAAAALERLARLLRDADLPRDAEHYYGRLAREFGDTKLTSGQTARQLVHQLRHSGTISPVDAQPHPTWGDFDLKLVRTGTNYNSNSLQTLDSGEFQLPFFRKFRFQVSQTWQRLGIVNVSDGSLYWSLPLRSKAGSMQGSRVAARAIGHQWIVLHRDVLHCLSPVERKVRWTRPLEIRGRPAGYYRTPNVYRIQQMQPGSSIASRSSLAQQSLSGGMLAVANADYLCTYGRRRFTVLDALTGEVRWTRDGLPPNSQIYGTDDVIYVVPQDRNQSVALRPLDGKQLDVPNFANLLAGAIHVSGNGFVLVESNSVATLFGLSFAKTTVRLYDPLADQERWKHEFAGGTYFSLLAGGQLAVLKPNGALQLVDLQTGTVESIGNVDKSDLKSKTELYTVADEGHVYLFVNRKRSGSYYSSSLPSVRVNGLVIALDRSTGKQLWRQEVSEQNLVLEQLNNLPILVFFARKYIRKGKIGYSLSNLLALDKQSGRKLIDTKAPANSSFRWLDVNMVARYVELRSYNQRLRLTAVDRKSASTK